LLFFVPGSGGLPIRISRYERRRSEASATGSGPDTLEPLQKGYDSHRHKFTRDECSGGFRAAVESIAMRYPDAVINAGSHRRITVNFMQ
jgi:hypothetical protein